MDKIKKSPSNSEFTNYLLDLSRSRTLIFDLDDTIYRETDFLFYAYKQISISLEKRYSVSAVDVFQYLTKTFETAGREKILDNLQLKLAIKDNHFTDFCLNILRNTIVHPRIEPFQYFKDFINLTCQMQVFIITNGNPSQQKNKMSSILWGSKVGILPIYANEYSPKPNPASFYYLNEKYQLKDPVYVGDNELDFTFAKNCKIAFVEVFKLRIL